MPRKNANPLSELQQHARKLLAGLSSEIRSRKLELAQLEQYFEKLTGLAGLRAPVSPPRGARLAVGRINWSEVLAKLPQEFKASDIRKVHGLGNKRPSELFAAITRWIDSGTVKKKTRGVYLRVEKPKETVSKKVK